MLEAIKNDIKTEVENAIEGVEVTHIDLVRRDGNSVSIASINIKKDDKITQIDFKDDEEGDMKALIDKIKANIYPASDQTKGE